MLPKINRLKKKKDFEKVFRGGKGFKEDFLFLKVFENNLQNSRFGFIINKDFSRKATLRNKMKRRLRALVKLKLNEIKKGLDSVLVVYPGLETKDFWELEEVLTRLLKRAKIIS